MLQEQTYRPWEGRRAPKWARVWALARTGLSLPLASRWNLGIIGLIYMMVLGWIFILYVMASTDNPPIFVLGNNLYRDWFFNHPMFGFLVMILAATVGAAHISRDLQNNALVTFLSRSIRPIDYLAAKFLTLFLFLLSVTLGPALLLFLGQIAMGQEDLTWKSGLRDLAAILAHSIVIAVPVTSLVLAFSSLTRRPFVAGLLWSLYYLTTWALPGIREISRSGDWWKMVRLQNLTAHVGNWCYEKRPLRLALLRFDSPSEEMPCDPWISLVVLAAVSLLSLAIVRLRLRLPEERT